MNSRKLISLCAILLLLAACASPTNVHQDFTSIPSIDEQCKILNQKRQSVKIKKGRRDARKLKKNQKHVFTQLASATSEAKRHETPPSNTIVVDSLLPDPVATETEVNVIANKGLPIIYAKDAEELSTSETEVDHEHSRSRSVIESNVINQNGIETNLLPALAGVSGILTMILLRTYRRQSKQISVWAAQNPWKTRGLITAAHLGTCASALALGHHLSEGGFIISEIAKYTATSAIGAAVCLYPVSRQANYFKQKALDAVLFASGAVMMLYAGNHYEVTQQQNPVQPIYSFASKSTQIEWHVVKKEISTPNIKKQDDPKKRSDGEKAILTLFAILAFVGLGYGIAALACSLSCSGYEALAGIVAVTGFIGLIFGFVAIIRQIFGKKRKKKKENPELQAA